MESRMQPIHLPRRFAVVALWCAIVGSVAALGALALDFDHFLQGYRAAFAFWVGLSLGSLSVLMLHHLVAGTWGFIGQRLLEGGALTLPLMTLLYAPFFLEGKIRSLAYFSIWIGLAVLLRRWSLRVPASPWRFVKRLRIASAVGIILYLLLLTFASVDWYMSLEPRWYSSIFPWLLAVSHALTAFAAVVIALSTLAESEPLRSVLRSEHFHDYGNLLLAFVILWTYMMFSQYLIIWSGNIPEEVVWYTNRSAGGWMWVGSALVAFHFVVPVGILLLRRAKQSRRALGILSAGLLAAHTLFMGWLVLPSFDHHSLVTYWSAAASYVGIGGWWFLAFRRTFERAPTLPQHDPRFRNHLELLMAE